MGESGTTECMEKKERKREGGKEGGREEGRRIVKEEEIKRRKK